MTDALTRRALNRATLARQYLLERVPVPAIDLIEHLAGMQSQAPLAPYVGLWTRRRDFAPGELSALTEQRQVVRLHSPASVADMQMWSGLTRLREVFERLPLRTFRGPDRQVLYDLPDAPRPAEDTPAPPRFLPEYDNLLLSHKDRTRVIPGNCPVPLPAGNGATSGTVLIDGMWQSTWQIRDRTLRIQPFAKLTGADLDALLTEAAQLCAFLTPGTTYDIMIDGP